MVSMLPGMILHTGNDFRHVLCCLMVADGGAHVISVVMYNHVLFS